MRGFATLRLLLLACVALVLTAGCCTPNQSDTVAPTVLSVSPVAATSVACPNAIATVVFSKVMNPGTINGATLVLTGPGASSIAGQVSYNAGSSTASFTPAANLSFSTVYTVTLTTGAQDVYGNPLASNFTWSFTTAANGCHPAATLISMTPAAVATGVCPNAAVIATFSGPMNPATITAASFTLSPGVVGTVNHDATNTIYTLTSSSALALNATYTITLTNAVKDIYGNTFGPFTSSFTTAKNGCNPAPLVTSVTPPNAATGICPNKVLTATFSEAMNAATFNAATFTLAGPGGAPVAGQVSYDPATHTAIFAPGASLALSAIYTATVDSSVQDLFGNSLAANFVWSFTTGSSTCLPAAPPIAVTPANLATGVCPSTVVAATFLQAMDPVTINATTFTLTGPGAVPVAGQITQDTANKMFTFTPTAALALNTAYTATLTTGAHDTGGAPLAANFTWTFTTGASTCAAATLPTVITVSPSAGSMGVCANAIVSATFSAAMNPATINMATFALSNGTSGLVTLDATGKIAVFTPAVPLVLNTTYMATITTGAKDSAGNALAANYTWSFTTAALACQSPVPLGTAANFEILAASTVTNTGATVVTGGDLGLSPGTSVTGFPTGVLTAPAAMHVTDLVAAQAQLDLIIAYNYASGLSGGAPLPADISGKTFTPGLYTNATSVTLSSGNVTLDAQGNPNAVFIFQAGSTLITLGNTQVLLTGGAQAKNIYWQVGSSATLGTNSVFKGTILALQSITLQMGASLDGRALARSGAVTLDTNRVTAP